MQNKKRYPLLFLPCIALCITLCGGMLASCTASPDPTASSAFQALRLDGKGNLTAEVSLDLREVQAHTGQKAYLYELLPGEELSALTDKQPVAEAKVASSVRFQFSLTEGEHTRLYSTFVLGYSDGTLLPSLCRVPENPETIASSTVSFLWSTDPKGLALSDAADAAALGCPHGMVEVHFSSLLSASDLTHSFRGTEYALSGSTVTALDQQIRSATDAGLQVSLRITPDSGSEAQQTALLDFLTARYAGGEHGSITAIFADFSTLDAAVDRAARFVTLAQRALGSRVENGRVYAMAPQADVEGTKQFFEALGNAIGGVTSMSWGAAVTLAESDSEPWDASDEALITPKTLSTFFTALRAQKHHPTWLALCDLSFDSLGDEALQAVSYAYTYAQASAAGAGLIYCKQNALSDTEAEFFAEIDTGLNASLSSVCQSVSAEAWTSISKLTPTRKTLSGIGSYGSVSGTRTALFDFTSGDCFGFSAVGSISAPESHLSKTWNAPVLYTWLNTSHNETGVQKVLSNGTALKGATALSAQVLAQYASSESCTLTLRLQGMDTQGKLLTYQSQATVAGGRWQTATFQISPFLAEADLSRPCVLTLLTSPIEKNAENSENTENGENFVFWVKALWTVVPVADYSMLTPILLTVGGVGVTFLLIFLLYRISSGRRMRSRQTRD